MAHGAANRDKIIENVGTLFPFCAGTVRASWYQQGTRMDTGKLDPQDRAALQSALDAGITYVVWSFATPIAWRTAHAAWVMPEAGYSTTTRHHKALVRQGMAAWDAKLNRTVEACIQT